MHTEEGKSMMNKQTSMFIPFGTHLFSPHRTQYDAWLQVLYAYIYINIIYYIIYTIYIICTYYQV